MVQVIPAVMVFQVVQVVQVVKVVQVVQMVHVIYVIRMARAKVLGWSLSTGQGQGGSRWSRWSMEARRKQRDAQMKESSCV